MLAGMPEVPDQHLESRKLLGGRRPQPRRSEISRCYLFRMLIENRIRLIELVSGPGAQLSASSSRPSISARTKSCTRRYAAAIVEATSISSANLAADYREAVKTTKASPASSRAAR